MTPALTRQSRIVFAELSTSGAEHIGSPWARLPRVAKHSLTSTESAPESGGPSGAIAAMRDVSAPSASLSLADLRRAGLPPDTYATRSLCVTVGGSTARKPRAVRAPARRPSTPALRPWRPRPVISASPSSSFLPLFVPCVP